MDEHQYVALKGMLEDQADAHRRAAEDRERAFHEMKELRDMLVGNTGLVVRVDRLEQILVWFKWFVGGGLMGMATIIWLLYQIAHPGKL